MIERKILIPSKLYVGLSFNIRYPTAYAYMAPYDTTSIGQKRMDTINRSKDSKIDGVTIENCAISGFKITNCVDLYAKNSGVWIIQDPRGFSTGITINNLNELLPHVTVENGEILTDCIWAREGSINYLLSVNTDVYKNAMKFTQIKNSKSSWKDVKIGNRVTLQNGNKGIYYGKMYVTTSDQLRSSYVIDSQSFLKMNEQDRPDSVPFIAITGSNYHIIYDDINNHVYILSSAPLSSIDSTDIIEQKSAEIEINKIIRSFPTSSSYKFYSNKSIVFLTYNKIDIDCIDYELTPLTQDEIDDIDFDSYKIHVPKNIFYVKSSYVTGILYGNHNYQTNTTSYYVNKTTFNNLIGIPVFQLEYTTSTVTYRSSTPIKVCQLVKEAVPSKILKSPNVNYITLIYKTKTGTGLTHTL